MPFQRKHPLPEGEIPKKKTRVVGTPNYKEVRSDFVWVYKRLGGRKALLEWALHSKDAQETFYRELLRLMPKELSEPDNPVGNVKLIVNLDPKEPWESKKSGPHDYLRPKLDVPKFS